ncbi:type II toxin-antitoxin system RelE/ParE family toxin [Paraburkholderia sp. CNPSo 3272]|uniref:type II toxin-antitoxin system RelE/ParE family toxin n=1 Tax=Paraburkholderia sp. CNPSo 3272 TaxID=2940931 RepID=UPI0020B8B886|nr:type II toxin-antitoxin system RelE/ParE family toxin [Paraburkholderia sp. CNPSo 3272]MCP3727291.1 type II toxin-antitoxin system RelE/ParE family toxin [Paraburkholderia sp. CNPSo 3272]
MKVCWSPLALADREALFNFTVTSNPRRAVAWDERISASVRRLRLFPNLGRVGRVSSTRELVVESTPLVLAYRYENEALTILRVLHGARRWPDAID